jgi:ATP-dependent Lhr-like helicase
MALALQEAGIGRRDWLGWVKNVQAFEQMPPHEIDHLVEWMLQEKILWDDAGILWLGRTGEETYGRKNFLELFSVFSSPPQFTVLHGQQELGFVDEATFLQRKEGPRVLLLGGRAWQVNHIDWSRRVAYVEATEGTGRSRWKGQGHTLNFHLCQAIKRVLAGSGLSDRWSQRAQQKLEETRGQFPWLHEEGTTVIIGGAGRLEWWTFGGTRANGTIACELSRLTGSQVSSDSFTVSFDPRLSHETIDQALNTLRTHDVATMHPAVDERALDGLKFSDCLPPELAVHVLELRLNDEHGVRCILGQPTRFVVAK